MAGDAREPPRHSQAEQPTTHDAGRSRHARDSRCPPVVGGSMSFVVMVHYRAREGEADRVRAALLAMVEPTRAEPGNEAYEVCVDPADPAVFAIYERYADEAA